MSNVIRIANLIERYRPNETGFSDRYNNSEPGKTMSHGGRDYKYLSFIYQGAAKSLTGDNIQASLILSTNPISTGIAKVAVEYREHLKVTTVSLNKDGGIIKVLTEEDWVVASMSYDPSAIEVLLSSGIDAVGANAPTRVLTRAMVGALPVTANIQAR